MPYLLDSNVFIESKNRHYGFDFCPAFWDWVDESNNSGLVYSVERVYQELQQGVDELADWTKARHDALFLIPDSAVIASLQVVSAWATGQGYRPDALATFLDSADYYLIACAHAHKHTVVTHERFEDTKRRVKIPNACIALGVSYLNPFEMLRNEKALFKLNGK